MCSGTNCSSSRIVNVKYDLCDDCNSVRLTGKTKAERQKESATKFRNKQQVNNQIRSSHTAMVKPVREKKDRGLFVRHVGVIAPPKKVYMPIRQQTSKEAGVKSKLHVLKNEIEMDAVQNNEYFCCGCGHAHPGLDKSHILSVGQYKPYELIKENIQLMCRDCHLIWESGAIEQQLKLECFVANVIWIFSIGEMEAYNKIITRIESYIENMAWAEHAQFDLFSSKYQQIISKC